jgi:hypothetical protein
MTATLTDSYISATVRTLPPEVQEDVRAELSATIADDIEARLKQGEVRKDAERAVLTALGDPDVLAAGYADRTLQLIGPRYYLTWWRLLKLLWVVVPVTAVAGVLIAQLIIDAPIADTVSALFAVAIGTIVHVGFWTTLVFIVLERTGAGTGARWTLDALPEPQKPGAARGDLIASLVFLGISAGALLWDQFVGFVFVAENGVDISAGLGSQTTAIPLLNPDLWPWWLGGMLILIAFRTALAIAVYASRGWNSSFAWLNTTLAVGFSALVTYLLITSQLFNPDFVHYTLGRGALPPSVGGILAVLLEVGVVGASAWGATDGWRKSRRSPHPLA